MFHRKLRIIKDNLLVNSKANIYKYTKFFFSVRCKKKKKKEKKTRFYGTKKICKINYLTKTYT